MLTELHIENLGVIERVALVLGPGLSAVTGETGAGKTMLVEAIELLVGGRAESSMVRHGADPATAMRALTTVPARILGVDAEFGSIEVGKVANLQVLTGSPLAATTWVETVLLEGEVAYERSKDQRLQLLFGGSEGEK